MPNNNAVFGPYTPPFRYDQYREVVWDSTGKAVVDVRGYWSVMGMLLASDYEVVQTRIGEIVARALNEEAEHATEPR